MKIRTFFRRMTYFLLLLLGIWALAVQSGCFAMRTTDAAWAQKLQEKGQPNSPDFLDVADQNGRIIHAVAIHTEDSLPLVIFVHGSPGSSDAFLDYLADTALSKVARLVAIDRPGFGYTSGFGKPEPSMEAQAKAITAIIAQLSPRQKVVLVSHSLGGPVTARFAMDYPELTAGLVLVAGSIDPQQEKHPWWQKAVDVPPLKWLTPKALWVSNAEIIPLEKELEKMLPFWKNITCPVHVIHAVDDRLVPVANVDFARKMLVNSTDLQVEILPTGDHFILWSQSALVKTRIKAILNQ